jgi:peroxiredoxin
VFFWSTWCPHCREQIVDLNRQKARLDGQGIEVLLVDIGESANVVRRFANSNKLAFEIWMDSDGAVSERYQVSGIPTLVFIGDDGAVRASLHGLPDDYMEIFK